MMKNILFTLFLFLFTIKAQTLIQGKITSTKEKDLIYDVIIYNYNKKMIAGNSFYDPNFELKTQLPDSSYLLIRALGYENMQISLNKNTENKINIGEITLKENTQNIKEISIQAKQEVFEIIDGNTKVNVSESSLANAGNGLDLIKKIPGVVVQNNEIEILGRGAPLIIIDGREATQEELDGISSSQIASIEVIKNTSAEYSANTNSVLKITTLTQKYKGWNVKMKQEVTRATFFNYLGGLDLGYKKNKSVYFIHFDGFLRNNTFQVQKDNFFTHANTAVENRRHVQQRNQPWYNLNFNTTQELAPAHKLSFQTLNMYLGGIEDRNNQNYIHEPQKPISPIFSRAKLGIQKIRHSDNLTYAHAIDTNGKELKIFTDYAMVFNQLTDTIEQELNHSGKWKTTITKSESIGQVFSFNPQLIFPIKKYSMSFQTGGKYSFLHTKSDYVVDGALSTTKIHENLFAIYAQVQKTYRKFNFNLGVRYEFAHAEGQDIEKGELSNWHRTFLRKFSDVFPNFSAGYQINKDIKTNLSYAYKIRRPSLNELNSLTLIVDSLAVMSGNPYLVPAYNHVLDYNISYKIASLSFSYIHSKNPFFHYTRPEGLKENRIVHNFERSDKYSVALNVPYQYKFWTTSNSFTYTYQQIEDEIILKDSGPSLHNFQMSLFNEFKVKNWFSFDVVYQFNTSGLFGIYVYQPRHILTLNINKKLWKDRIEVYFQWNDILDQDRFEIRGYVEGLRSKARIFQDNSYLRLGVNFKLNQLNHFIKAEKNVNGEEGRI